MLQRSYIYVVIFLMTIVGAGCSDNHETTSVHTHTDDNVLVRKNDTIAALQMLPKEEIATKSRSAEAHTCLLYTSPSPRDLSTSRMPSSA